MTSLTLQVHAEGCGSKRSCGLLSISRTAVLVFFFPDGWGSPRESSGEAGKV